MAAQPSTHELLAKCYEISEKKEPTYEEGEKTIQTLIDTIELIDPPPPNLTMVRDSTLYWQSKFARIKDCESVQDISNLFDEHMFTDPEEVRFNYYPEVCKFDGMAYQIFNTYATNKAWGIHCSQQGTSTENKDPMEKYEYYVKFLDDICIKHGLGGMDDYKHWQESLKRRGTWDPSK